MTLNIEEFTRKPFPVQAVKVTADNIREVAEWCGGEFVQPETKEDGSTDPFYVQVSVHGATDARQTQARVGDRVLRQGRSFKVYTERAFKKSFDLVKEDSEESDRGPVLDTQMEQLALHFNAGDKKQHQHAG